MRFIFNDNDFSSGLLILESEYGFLELGGDFPVTVKKGDMLSVNKLDNSAEIIYTSTACFFRAVGLLAQHFEKASFSFNEKVNFTSNGVMFDVSQGNAAPNIDVCKLIIRRMSIMGLNLMMLYCEDSYTIPQYPYFGYMRARYGYDELKELDDYAYNLGVELVPCIQTLAHLHEALKWSAFEEIKQDADMLLVGEDKTYDFIRAAITAASSPFRSRRIHIGMDEAWSLGMGEYYKKHGPSDSLELMCYHLSKVLEIVYDLNLQPMMWCDMFFRSVAPDGDYYSLETELTTFIINKIPEGVDLIYWDYYHTKKEFYGKFIEKFIPTGKKPIFAGGVWSWYGYGVNYGLTFETMLPALASCVEHGIESAFLTVWGDNGTESHILSNLPALMLFAEFGYGEFNCSAYEKRFEFCCKCNFKDVYSLKLLDEIPGVPEGNPGQCNCSKYLMWNDLLCGLFDYNVNDIPMRSHYGKLSEIFENAHAKDNRLNQMFRFYHLVCRALEYKAEAGVRLLEAYRAGNNELKKYLDFYLPELKKRMQDLHEFHRVIWMQTYKHLGWDVLDMRYAAVEARIDTAKVLIEAYLAGEINVIEELEEKRLPFDGFEGIPGYANHYGRICSASRIAPEH